MNKLTKNQTNYEHQQPLAELVALVDLPALVARYSGPGKGAGNKFTFRCPNPQHPDNTPSFTVERKGAGKWRAHCWSQCTWTGDALDLVCWLEGCDVLQGKEKLRAFMGLPASDIWVPPAQKQPAAPPTLKPQRPIAEQLQATRTPSPEMCEQVLAKYLLWRGWPDDVVHHFGLSVVLDDWGRVRVRHPFHEPTPEGRKVVAWQDRAKGDALPKWIGPEGVALPLYNLDALTDEVRAVVICEGPADTISATVALHQSAHPRIIAVGVAGTGAWRHDWAHLFAGRRVLTAADSDTAADKLREAVEESLRPVALSLQHLLLPKEVKDLTDWCLQCGYGRIGDDLATVFSVALLKECGLTAEVVA